MVSTVVYAIFNLEFSQLTLEANVAFILYMASFLLLWKGLTFVSAIRRTANLRFGSE